LRPAERRGKNGHINHYLAIIIRRSCLPIEIDPVRPADVSSSDEEHESAIFLAITIRYLLSSCGWPEPLD